MALCALCVQDTIDIHNKAHKYTHKSQIFITMNNSLQGYCVDLFDRMCACVCMCLSVSDVCNGCDGQMSDSIPKEFFFRCRCCFVCMTNDIRSSISSETRRTGRAEKSQARMMQSQMWCRRTKDQPEQIRDFEQSIRFKEARHVLTW